MKIIAVATSLILATTSLAFAQQARPNAITDLPGGQLMVAGIWLKAASGSVDIPFGTTFSDQPIVVVSPNYTSGVGSIETVTRVDKDKFQVTSANAASNFYVSWIAVGKK
jgi:hypothetical protein